MVSFGPPCTAAEIARAEREIGQALPAFLRELYLACDGFRGPTGSLLWPLFGDNGLVGYNRSVRVDRNVPAFVRGVVFFGDDGIGGTVGAVYAVDPARPDRILEWYVNEPEPAVAAANVFELWRSRQQEYDEHVGKGSG